MLREVAEPDASYTFTGDERYVRAKVLESNGAVAWTQPVGVGTAGAEMTGRRQPGRRSSSWRR